MYAFYLQNKKTYEQIIIMGYNWKDAVERMGKDFNADDWRYLMQDYND